ncbi:MAG: hypothetical protein Ta2A_23670 [Treponemataceae bacterium]|nr:MAG: hypothetical protein Ta2A_23670 [Treponemataceae bacterium]
MDSIFSPLQRGIILQALEQAPEHLLSNEFIQRALRAMGQSLPMSEVIQLILYLENRGFVKCERMEKSAFVTVTATRNGIEAARGIAHIPGIDLPLED